MTSDDLRNASFPIVGRQDANWDEARQAWNLTVDQEPAAVALPENADDVIKIVEFARANGLRVAAQTTGHNASPLGSLDDTILIKTSAMRAVDVNPETRIARVEAGVLAGELVEVAADHNLAALVGTAADVGLVGYTIGGGISWLSRAHGLAANGVQAIELVTADGRRVRADAVNEADLFWALRGGGGSFGVVTAIEMRLLPITEVYAGQLWWPIDAASDVLQTWRELTESNSPDAFTSAARLMHFPDNPNVPERFRGRSFVIAFVCHIGTASEADALIAPLRALEPQTDTLATIAVETLSDLHMDPGAPTPAVADALLLERLSDEAMQAFIEVAGSRANTRLVWAELMHLGGEIKRSQPGGGALSALEAEYQLATGGGAPTLDVARPVEASLAALLAAMTPWASRQMYLNVATTARDPASFWMPDAYERLRCIKAHVDPDDLIRSNHPIPAR
jgi:FAD/FMN-containing dehydrogenase